MTRKTKYPYFTGFEPQQYTFYRIPKTLMEDERYKDVSLEAKLLYGIFLDRMSLSIKNEWIDSKNRVYIKYSTSEIMEILSKSKNTVFKLIGELEAVGLVEKKVVGQGRTNLYYVKNIFFDLGSRTLPKRKKKVDDDGDVVL